MKIIYFLEPTYQNVNMYPKDYLDVIVIINYKSWEIFY